MSDSDDIESAGGGFDRRSAARLEAAISELPPVQRKVVLLSRLAGMSHAEIAERFGKSELAVRTILSRALTRVAARI